MQNQADSLTEQAFRKACRKYDEDMGLYRSPYAEHEALNTFRRDCLAAIDKHGLDKFCLLMPDHGVKQAYLRLCESHLEYAKANRIGCGGRGKSIAQILRDQCGD